MSNNKSVAQVQLPNLSGRRHPTMHGTEDRFHQDQQILNILLYNLQHAADLWYDQLQVQNPNQAHKQWLFDFRLID